MNFRKREVIQVNINSSHYVQSKDRYVLNLGEMVDFTGAYISLISANCYNSTYNITSEFGNNRIGVQWINGQIYNYVIPDGTYSIADINSFLEARMFEDNLYVNITATGKAQYFIKLQENPIYYSCHAIITYVPNQTEATSLGYSKPSGAMWNFPSVGTTPQLLLINQNMGTLLGYTSLTIPSSPFIDDNYELLSQQAPRLSPIFNYMFNCSLLNHQIGRVASNRLFFQIPVSKGIGQLLEYQPNYKQELRCSSAKTDYIEIYLTDENFNKLIFKDKDISVVFIIEFYEKI
jgi:hypothetical protein